MNVVTPESPLTATSENSIARANVIQVGLGMLSLGVTVTYESTYTCYIVTVLIQKVIEFLP